MSPSTRDAALRARVLSSVEAEPSPSRPALERRTRVALGGSGALLAAVALTGRGPHSHDVAWWLGAGWLALMSAAATTLALTGRRPVSVAVRRAWIAVVAAALGVAASVSWLPDPFASVPPAAHGECSAMTLGLGAALALTVTRARSGSDPIAPARTGLLIGVLAGLWSAATIAFRCGHAQVDHLLVSHVAPVLIVAVAGLIAGKRWLSVR
ncbi:NrsF family protein [Sorangium sp. So ce1151]|uniref:NrsF family protein n=1 Tax=Sorangium sp. So ce1151 TaxID=3133332 RepID=UPI003F5D56D9